MKKHVKKKKRNISFIQIQLSSELELFKTSECSKCNIFDTTRTEDYLHQIICNYLCKSIVIHGRPRWMKAVCKWSEIRQVVPRPLLARNDEISSMYIQKSSRSPPSHYTPHENSPSASIMHLVIRPPPTKAAKKNQTNQQQDHSRSVRFHFLHRHKLFTLIMATKSVVGTAYQRRQSRRP